MPPKRPIRNVFGNDDDDPSSPDNTQSGTPPKRPRPDSSRSTIHRAGIAPPPPQPQHAASSVVGQGAGADNSIQAQVAAAKARAQALMSALQNKGSAPSGSGVSAPSASSASAPSRSITVASASNGRAAGAPAAPVAGAASTVGAAARATPGGSTSIQAQLEAARAKVQAQMAALNAKNKTPAAAAATHATIASTSTSSSSSSAPVTTQPSSSKAPTGIHPLLLSNNVPYKPKLSEHASKSTSSSYVKGRNNVPPELNPYLQASRESAVESAEGPKQRSMHKGFQFHKPGRHVREAEELRREQQMEELKKRIEESARKVGMQDGLEGNEKRLLRQPPPDVEWWDINLLSHRSYDAVPEPSVHISAMLEQSKLPNSGLLIYGKDSPIDHYIQHPVPIPAPTDKFEAQPRGLMLTKKEQRKLRRQRRAAEQADKRDRIKMGLLPPDPPKVKLSNLMRVLTSEAVSDPTKIEARVRREIAARKETHERQNAERKLTDEQRREKVEKKKEADEKKGLFCQVYRVKHLVSPRHKFKIRRNAQDHGMTGVCLFSPSMAVVVVEGSGKACKAYKRLMTVRIDWTDPGEPKQNESEDEDNKEADTGNANANNVPLGGFRSLTTSEEDLDWTSNTCELIFEGPIRERNWEGRGFRAVAAPTDQAARDALGPTMQGYWDVAKRTASVQDETL